MRVVDVVQGSPEWLRERCGLVTSSEAHVLFARGRDGGESKQRSDYLARQVKERLAGVPLERDYCSTAMALGKAKEPLALAAYAQETGVALQRCGLVVHDELAAGASLDSYVGSFEGIVEVKAPNSDTHFKYLQLSRSSANFPEKYRAQLTHQLWITGARWCDFVSFDNRFPFQAKRLSIVRVSRDQVDVRGHERAVRRFLAEVDLQVDALLRLTPAEFFARAPLDVAHVLLARCRAIVNERERTPEIPSAPPPRRLQPALAFAGLRS